jgi:PTH1 family peptidyl-tRNA hydrolase
VGSAARDLGLPPERLWVVHDEIDLPLCRLRIRWDGSAAGHNGIRSIISALGSQAFVRFRVGVGRPPSAQQGARHVLGRFTRVEAKRLDQVVEAVAAALELGLREGLGRAMETYNRTGSLGCEELP